MTGLLGAASLAGRTCWLFDLDGTLVDSGPAHDRAFRVALAELWPAGLAGFRYADHLGRPTTEVVAGLGAPPPVVARKQALYRQYVDEGQVAVAPGAVDLLAALAGRGRYVVTGASRSSAERVLAATGLAGWFDGMVAAEDVPAGKPDPAAYREACRRYAPAGDLGAVVAVEDSPQGVRSAVAAGLLTVHVQAGEPAGAVGAGVLTVSGLEALRRLLGGPG